MKAEAKSSLLPLIPSHASPRIYNVDHPSINDLAAKLNVGIKLLHWVLMERLACAQSSLPDGVSLTSKLAEVQFHYAEEQGLSESVEQAPKGEGVT